MPPAPASPRQPLALRLLLAALLTAVLLATASAALSVTTAPAFVSLLVEPFSLLLMPGFLVVVATSGRHDEVSSRAVLLASACLYFVVFSVLLTRRRTRTHSRSR